MIKFDYLFKVILVVFYKSIIPKTSFKCSDCEGRSQIGGQK